MCRRTQRLKSTGYLHPDTGSRFAAPIPARQFPPRDLTGIDFDAVLTRIIFRGLSQTGRDKTFRKSQSTMRFGDIEVNRASRPRFVSMRRILLDKGMATTRQLRLHAQTAHTVGFGAD